MFSLNLGFVRWVHGAHVPGAWSLGSQVFPLPTAPPPKKKTQIHSCASFPLGVPAQPHSPSHHCRGGKLGAHALQPIEQGHCGSHPAQMTAPQGIWQGAGQKKAAPLWAQASVISRQVHAHRLRDLGEFSQQPWFGGNRLMRKGRCLTQLPRTPP